MRHQNSTAYRILSHSFTTQEYTKEHGIFCHSNFYMGNIHTDLKTENRECEFRKTKAEARDLCCVIGIVVCPYGIVVFRTHLNDQTRASSILKTSTAQDAAASYG